MPSKLGNYILLRTLGSGGYSKVKLAQHSETGEYFAIKIMKDSNEEHHRKMIESVISEVKTMSQFKKEDHPFIVNLVEYNREGVLEKDNGAQRRVFYIVLELASGGELFDFVASTGAFSELVARYFFRQLIEGLDSVHRKGITHRDLKPENLLYDKNFNLKIADFGFAAPLAGRDGSHWLSTMLGTFGYMAPEIIMRLPYNGA
jgi:serine/threonine protein kinase